MRQHIPGVAVAILLGAFSVPAFAINGFFAHGYGTKSKAMAGVGVALSLDGLTPAANPAGLVDVDDRTDVDLSFFHPIRAHKVRGEPTGGCASNSECTFGIGPQDRDSGMELFFIPSLGLVRKIDGASSWAFSVYGNGGLNTEFHGGSATYGVPTDPVPPGSSVTTAGVYGGDDTGIDLSQLFLVPSYARRLGANAEWGIAPILAVQRFRAKGLRTFRPFSSEPDHLSNNGYDHSIGGGGRVGARYHLGPNVTLGASWQSRIYMSKFDKYAGLFADGGDLDIPATYTAGIAVRPVSALTLALDVQQIEYGSVRSVGNRLLPNLVASRLGEKNGAGFGWRDMTIYKFGVAYDASGARTWRLGYSYGDQQIPESQLLFNILAPSLARHHVTAGLSQRLSEGRELNFSIMVGVRNALSGRNPLDPAQEIEISARIFEFEVGYSWGGR